ncbi:hypothetical protein FACS1894133_3570 [Clostridia bacterium]|nr:hypothetical protein FACS1894133_3570 [Clostridia bacterium]
MTKQEQLYDKCTAELDAFVDDLKTKPIDEILVLAYEKVAREEITEALNSDDFLSAEEAEALLALDKPLEALYNDWLDTEEFHGDVIRESIETTAARVKDDAEPHADKETAQVKAKEKTPSAQAINGEIACYDVVISTGDSDYPFLVGEVNAVDKFGSEEHNSGNLTDDVFVDFQSEEYSANRIKEIEEHFSKLYGESKRFADIPLDNVIMSPEWLIRVKESDIQALLESRENAEKYCDTVLNGANDIKTELMSRIEQNYADFKQSLDSFSKAELIGMASKIHAMSDAHCYLTMYYEFSNEELLFYSKFQNPLEVVASIWHKQNVDVDDVYDAMEYISDRREAMLNDYPLLKDAVSENKSAQQSEPEKAANNPAADKEKSSFDKALSRGKDKSEAYKSQKAGEPAADKKKKAERS